MSDFKSKLPDFKEITSIASKFFNDVSKSVSEIITDYKKKRAEPETGEVVSSAAKKTTQDEEVVVAKTKKTSSTGEEEVATVATAKKAKPTKPKATPDIEKPDQPE
ncbi:hypothetical protein [Legionella clemsonensis]|uniref:Uncharacterized protein n=1 Tax=Legionella clemsonensis TaxID=1867846 RepID=A0A222P3C8_9GAMM|nr:hypothetical protein [Legionella clemsonensis]ASQ46332.1 hypothetical protein clem_08905 [Legionella clemsonensis]